MMVTLGKVTIQEEEKKEKVKPSRNVHMLMTNLLMVIMTIKTEMMIIVKERILKIGMMTI